MKETIRFKGLTLNRDEMGVEHGEMSLCGNVELHDGALRASTLDGTQLADGDDLPGRLIYVHETASYKNYISVYYNYVVGGVAREEYYWRDGDIVNSFMDYSYVVSDNGQQRWESRHVNIGWDGMTVYKSPWNLYNAGRIHSINSVGNTLILLTDTGLHYFLCEIITAYSQPTATRYKYLGQQPPFLELQFNLYKGDSTHGPQFYSPLVINKALPFHTEPDEWVFVENISLDYYHVKGECEGEVTDAIMANVNWATAQCTGFGYFYAPFLVRYAYRLYDGTSLIMHSPPVLMMPQLKAPVKTWIQPSGDMYVYLIMGQLQVKCLNPNVIDDQSVVNLKAWSDIVKSVDIFITPQLSRIDASKPIDRIKLLNFSDTSDEMIKTFTEEKALLDGAFVNVKDDYDRVYPDRPLTTFAVDFPMIPEDEYLERVANASTFFRLTSVNIEDIDKKLDKIENGVHVFKDVEFEVSHLQNITAQPQMTDDYKTHNLLLPVNSEKGGSYVYNKRLNVYGISERLFKGFSPDVLFPYSASGLSVSEVDTWVNTDQGLRKVTNAKGTGSSWTVLQWLVEKGFCFYPNSRAIRMSFATNTNYYRRMVSHPELNGSYSFMPVAGELGSVMSAVSDDVVPMPNKIYTSRADNPFYFPNLPGESGINTIGEGDIIGLAVPMRSLTDDQAGFNDLVIFCTDGIWTAKVSNTGTYAEKHNIEGEVCINKDSICQLDQSVVFATDRSLSRYAAQNVVSMTDVLDGPFFDIGTKLPGLTTYLTQQSLADVLRLVAFDTAPEVYYRNGKVFYDYLGSRIIVFRENLSSDSIALVFSIRDQAWSTMDVPPLRAVLNSYPTPYIQDTDGVVTRLDTPYDHESETLHNGIVVTRSLSYSDTMDLIRGFRQLTNASHMPLLFFYGSNDQRSWQELGRSARAFHNYIPGHPFRFFRVAIVMQMLTAERYQELELEIINKYAKL